MNPLEQSSVNVNLPAVHDSQHLHSSLLFGLTQGNSDAAGGLPPGLSAAPTFGGLMHAFRRRWAIGVILATAVAGGTVLAVLAMLPPQFVAQLRYRVAARGDMHLFSPGTGEDGTEFNLIKLSQQALIASPSVIARALKERLPDGREVRELGIVRDKGAGAIDWLEKAIKSDYLTGPETLRVSLGADDPDEVAILLNAIGKAFMDTNYDMASEQRKIQLDRYEEQRVQLDNAHHKLLNQLASENKASVGKDHEATHGQLTQAYMVLNMVQTSWSQLRNTRVALEAELAALNLKLKEPGDLPAKDLEAALAGDLQGAAYITDLTDVAKKITAMQASGQAAAVALSIRRERERARYLTQQLDKRREEIRPEAEKLYQLKVREETREAIAATTSKLTTVKAQEDSQYKEVKSAEANVLLMDKNAKNKPIPIQVLEDKINNSRAVLDELTRKIQLSKVEQPRSRVTLINEAMPPNKKDYTRQLKLGGGGALAMFGLVLFAVSFLEFRSRKISDPKEVSHGLRLNVVGALPAMPVKLRRSSVGAAMDLQGQVWTTQLNEAVDAVRTLLLHASRTDALRVVMVTSADAGEGKTTLASQLATSLARAWRRTLLIDGDLRHPATHALFELPNEPGLSEVLRGEVQANDAIRATQMSRLWVLPAGTCDPHAIQALAQDDVRLLIETLKQQYDFIVVDSPPVLPVADSLLLGQHMDGVLFSVLRDVSRGPAVYAAQQKLQSLGIRILGAVMVGAETDSNRGHYRYLTHATTGTG